MSGQGESSMSQTFTAGSEEDFDVLCDPCLNEGQRAEATGHCIDCRENLCASCFKLHKKFSGLKDHTIHDNSTLSNFQKSQASANQSAEDKDPLTDRCPKHPEELIKFYCNSHYTLGCSVCIPMDHRLCDDISYIRDIADDVADISEHMIVDLQMLVARFTSTQNRSKWIKQTMNDSYSKTVSDISDMKKEIVELLDNLESDILERASLMKEENITTLDTAISSCESMIEETEGIIADIEKKRNLCHNNSLFIYMKNSQDRISTLDHEASHLSNRLKCEYLSFQPDKKLNDIHSTLHGLGTISMTDQTLDVKVVHTYDINIQSDTDTLDSLVEGIIALPDERVAIVDYKNQSVKLFDDTHLQKIDEIKFEFKPLDLTLVKEDKIAITVQGERYVGVLSVSPSLSKCNIIHVPGIYHGIEYFSDRLFLVCFKPVRGLHICDMSGALLQEIEPDYGGYKLFKCPARIAISLVHSVMYITDPEAHAVVTLTLDGTVINKNNNDKLNRPHGLAVSEDGSVYACSEYNHTVQLLSPDGQLLKIMLEKKDGVRFPHAITYRAGHLFISNNDIESAYRHKINVYRLET